MLRTIIWFVYFWLYQLYCLPKLFKVGLLRRQNKIAQLDREVYGVVIHWARSLINLTGSEIKVTGAENVPKEGAVLFVSNHQGRFDIPLILGFIDKPKGFIAKIEMAKMPLVSDWMKYMKCIFMDRKDVRQSLRAINQGVEFLKSGYSEVIFPEGTRSIDGTLGDFKAGSFKLATKSGVPIIPVTIKGSYRIMDNKSFIIKPALVEVIISPPVDPAIFKDINQLANHVKEIIGRQLLSC